MAKTCYVRYPDAETDKPDSGGEPSEPIKISAHKLDDYRRNGFVQCDEDGGKVTNPIPAVVDPKRGKLAGVEDDPEAALVRGDAPAKAVAAPKPGGKA